MNDSSSYHNTHLELDQFLIISESSSRLSVTEGWYHLRLRVSSCLARIISKSLIGGDRYIQGMIGKNTDLLFYCEIDDRVDDWSVFFVVSEPGIFWILREREKKQREVSMAITRPKVKGVARSIDWWAASSRCMASTNWHSVCRSEIDYAVWALPIWSAPDATQSRVRSDFPSSVGFKALGWTNHSRALHDRHDIRRPIQVA